MVRISHEEIFTEEREPEPLVTQRPMPDMRSDWSLGQRLPTHGQREIDGDAPGHSVVPRPSDIGVPTGTNETPQAKFLEKDPFALQTHHEGQRNEEET